MTNNTRRVAVFARVKESHRNEYEAHAWLVDICEGYAKGHGLEIARVETDAFNYNDISFVLERLVADLKYEDDPAILIAQPSQLSPASRLLLKAYKIRLITALRKSRQIDLGG